MVNWLNVNLFFLAAWCCLQMRAVIMEHHPVLEGSKTTLVCEGNSSRSRYVYWKVTRFNTLPSAVSTCMLLSKTCQDNNNRKYQATIQAAATADFKSVLTIHNITYEDQNNVFECLVDGLPEIKQAWNLSKVFYGPDDFSCTAIYANISSEINITCYTSKVFPGLICESTQWYDKNKITNITSSIRVVYNRDSKSSERHTSATCFAVIPISKPGTYQYFITRYAGLTTGDRVSNNTKVFITNEVDVFPNVVIEHKTANRCQGPDVPELFWCTAISIPSPVSFLWSVDNGTKRTEIQTQDKWSGHFHRSTFELKSSEWRGLITVTCIVNYTQNSQKMSLKESISMQILSVERPYFTYNHKKITSSAFSLDIDTGTSSFECRLQEDKSVHDPRPDDVSLNVSCNSQDKPHTMMMSSINKGDSVTFTIHNNKTKPGFCRCSAYHKLNPECSKSTANITFFIPSEAASKSQEHGMTYLIYYIVAGTIGAILLIFTCGICLFLKRKWHELYTYIYFSFSAKSDRSPSERDYEPVGSPFSGFLSDRCEETRQCNRCQGYYNNSHGTFQGLATASMVHAGSKDMGLCKCNTDSLSLPVSPERTILQRDIHLLNFHTMGISEESSVTGRLLHNRSPSHCSFQQTSSITQCHLANHSSSHVSDESAWFDHDRITPPRPCMTYKMDSVWPINSLYESPVSSLHLNIPNDHYFPASACTESSESDDSFCTTTMSSLPVTDPETYLVPISNPGHNQTPQTVSKQNQFTKQQTYRLHTTRGLTEDGQSTRTPEHSQSTRRAEHSQSTRRPEYRTVHTGLGFNAFGAVHSNDVIVSKLPSRRPWSMESSSLISEYINTSLVCFLSNSHLEPSASIEDSSLDAEYINTRLMCYRSESKLEPPWSIEDSSFASEYINTPSMSYRHEGEPEPSTDMVATRCPSNVPSLLSNRPKKCEKRKHRKYHGLTGEHSHVPLKSHNYKSRSHSSKTSIRQTRNNRIHKNRNTRYNSHKGNETCVYENIQTIVAECSRFETYSLDI